MRINMTFFQIYFHPAPRNIPGSMSVQGWLGVSHRENHSKLLDDELRKLQKPHCMIDYILT